MLKNVVDVANVVPKENNALELPNVMVPSQNVEHSKLKELKIVFAVLENVVNFIEVVLDQNVTTKNYFVKIIKNVKLFVIKKTVKRCQKWRSIKSKTFSCRVRKCFRVLRTCCGVKCHNKKLSIKKHSKCHKNFGKCGKWMTKKNQTFNL